MRELLFCAICTGKREFLNHDKQVGTHAFVSCFSEPVVELALKEKDKVHEEIVMEFGEHTRKLLKEKDAEIKRLKKSQEQYVALERKWKNTIKLLEENNAYLAGLLEPHDCPKDYPNSDLSCNICKTIKELRG